MVRHSLAIYEQIKELVLKAEPDTFLSVRKCADELNFTYTPTREALECVEQYVLPLILPKLTKKI